MIKTIKNKKGLSMIEIVLGIAIFSLLTLGILMLSLSHSRFSSNQIKRINIEKLGLGIQKTANLIVDIFTSYCTNSPGQQLGWGWLHTSCNNTSIFPNFSTSGNMLVLTYNYNEGTLSISDRNKLVSEITSYFNFCSVTTATNQITITCPSLVNARYCIQGSTDCNNVTTTQSNSPHTVGRSYDYINTKILSIVVEYNEEGARGDLIQHRIGQTAEYLKPYFIDFGTFYVEMQNKNKQKLLDIYNAIRKYEVTKRILESENTSGLNEIDDYFIPWVFQITANSASNIYTVCSNATCSNLNSTNYWNNTLASTNMLTYMSNTVSYLLGNARSYYVDVFGNPIGIELIVNMSNYNGTSCKSLYSPTVGSNCLRVNPLPPTPRNNYSSVFALRPPFIGYIYSEFCHDLSQITYDTCRMAIVYVN